MALTDWFSRLGRHFFEVLITPVTIETLPASQGGIGTTGTTVGQKDSRITLKNNSVTGGAGAEVIFATVDTAKGRHVAIGTHQRSNISGDSIADFYFASKTAETDTVLIKRVTIRYDGNFGIGNSHTDPLEALHVWNKGGADHTTVKIQAGPSQSTSPLLVILSNGGGALMSVNAAGSVIANGGVNLPNIAFASRAAVITTGRDIGFSTTTDTELGYVNGVTSPIQTQLDDRYTKAEVDALIAGLQSQIDTLGSLIGGLSASKANHGAYTDSNGDTVTI